MNSVEFDRFEFECSKNSKYSNDINSPYLFLFVFFFNLSLNLELTGSSHVFATIQ